MARSASQRTLPEKPRALHERRRCRSSKPRRRRPGHPVGRTRATWGCVARPTGAPAAAGTARRSRRCQSRRRRATWRLPRLTKMCACVGEARGVHKHARVLIYTIRVLCMSLRSALNRPLPHLYSRPRWMHCSAARWCRLGKTKRRSPWRCTTARPVMHVLAACTIIVVTDPPLQLRGAALLFLSLFPRKKKCRQGSACRCARRANNKSVHCA